MKLYYMMGSCSLAANIALREAGFSFSLSRLDMKTQLLDDGRSIREVNEKGYVPVLELDSGERLTELSAILLWVADQRPEKNLAPPHGTMERFRLHEWLNYIATEIHKAYWPLMHHGADIENTNAREKLTKQFTWVEQKLGNKPYLMGDTYSVADTYLFVTVNWLRFAGMNVDVWPGLKAYRLRMRERAAVMEALKSEGMK